MNTIAIKPSSSNLHTSSYHKLINTKNNILYKPASYNSFSFSTKKLHQRKHLCISCSKLPTNFPSILTPLLQSIRKFTAKYKWVSYYIQDPGTEFIITNEKTRFLHNGGIGMALLTVKSTTRDRFSPFIATLAANPTFVSGLLALLLAQSMKILLNFIVERKWDLRILCASGGMPSSHSALCTALTTSVALCHGVADSLFPVCLGFSLIVMYDAIGVRRHAGMQAQVLNKIIEDLFQGHPISERKLKELLGHTPSQVVAGALLGIVVACFCCQGRLVSI